MNNQQFSHYVFTVIENDQYFDQLKNKYTEILADLTSSKVNPNCSCRNRVVNHLHPKYMSGGEDKTFLDTFFEKQEIKEKAEAKIMEMQIRIQTQSLPRILNVVKSGPDYWENFVKSQVTGKIAFRSFSVVDKGDSLDVYFI